MVRVSKVVELTLIIVIVVVTFTLTMLILGKLRPIKGPVKIETWPPPFIKYTEKDVLNVVKGLGLRFGSSNASIKLMYIFNPYVSYRYTIRQLPKMVKYVHKGDIYLILLIQDSTPPLLQFLRPLSRNLSIVLHCLYDVDKFKVIDFLINLSQLIERNKAYVYALTSIEKLRELVQNLTGIDIGNVTKCVEKYRDVVKREINSVVKLYNMFDLMYNVTYTRTIVTPWQVLLYCSKFSGICYATYSDDIDIDVLIKNLKTQKPLYTPQTTT